MVINNNKIIDYCSSNSWNIYNNNKKVIDSHLIKITSSIKNIIINSSNNNS